MGQTSQGAFFLRADFMGATFLGCRFPQGKNFRGGGRMGRGGAADFHRVGGGGGGQNHLTIHKQNLAFPHVTRARLESQR